MNLEGGCLLIVSPITSSIGVLLMSYTKVNFIMFLSCLCAVSHYVLSRLSKPMELVN